MKVKEEGLILGAVSSLLLGSVLVCHASVAFAQDCSEKGIEKLGRSLPANCNQALKILGEIERCDGNSPFLEDTKRRVRARASMICCGNAEKKNQKFANQYSQFMS